MHILHSGHAVAVQHFLLNGQKLHPICSLEGDDAETLIFFTSLLDFAGPSARRFFLCQPDAGRGRPVRETITKKVAPARATVFSPLPA
jgi:hypothetical protein